MPNILANIAKMDSATTGTGTLTLGAAVTGYLSFANAGVTNGQVVTYAIEDYDVSGNIIAREVGAGTYSSTGPTLTRDTVYSSTNAGAKINCSGLQYVFVSLAKEDLATFGVLSAANTWTANNTFSATTYYGSSAHGNIGSDATQMFVRGNNIAFQNAAASTTYAYINSSGNVGIGTAAPGKRLDVVGQLRASNTAASGYALFEYGSSATATNNWHVGSEGDGTFRWYNGTFGAGAELMRITSAGNVGIGTGNPSGYDAKLAVFNGNFALTTTTNRLYLYYASATNHAFLSAAAGGEITFSNGTASPSEKMRIDTSGNVGIGTGTSGLSSRLTVNGSFRQLAPTVPFEWTANAGANDFLKLNAVGYTDNLLTIVSNGRVGIGTSSPTGNLTVFSSAANDSSHIRVETNVRPSLSLINSGVRAWSFWVDTGDSNKLKIGVADSGISAGVPYITALGGGNVGVGVTEPTFRFVAGNSATDAGWIYSASAVSYLGLGGYSTAGSGAFQISYDRSTGTITFNGGSRDTPVPRVTILNTGVVGINQTSPGARLHITDVDAANALLVAGPTRGLRVFSSTTGATMEGVDQTGVGSYQPLLIGGSEVRFTTSNNERMRIHASGGISIGNTADPGANITSINATLRVLRQNTVSEGGEVQFCRANDNSVSWYIDVLGSAAGTDPGALRFIDNQGFDGAGAKVRAELSSRGVLNIVNDLGPLDTDTLAVGFRGAPHNDQTGTTYTFARTDAGRAVMFKGTANATWTIPLSTTTDFPIGTMIIVDNSHFGSGTITVTVQGATGVGIRTTGAGEATTGRASNKQVSRGGVMTLRKLANRSTTQSVTSITRVGTTATMTTPAAHGYIIGDFIEVAGAAQSQYNGTQRVLSVGTTTTLTYAMTADPGASASGTLTVRKADLWNATGNYGNV